MGPSSRQTGQSYVVGARANQVARVDANHVRTGLREGEGFQRISAEGDHRSVRWGEHGCECRLSFPKRIEPPGVCEREVHCCPHRAAEREEVDLGGRLDAAAYGIAAAQRRPRWTRG